MHNIRLLLGKCYDNKKFKLPYNWVISPLTQPQVANQQKKIKTIMFMNKSKNVYE